MSDHESHARNEPHNSRCAYDADCGYVAFIDTEELAALRERVTRAEALLRRVGAEYVRCEDWCGSIYAPNGGSVADSPWVSNRRFCTKECGAAQQRLRPSRTRVLDPRVAAFLATTEPDGANETKETDQ